MIKDDGTVIHFNNPKVQASLAANTFAVTGHGENKQITDLLPGILNQLGAESLTHLKKLASNVPSGVDGTDGALGAGNDADDDDDVPDLVENFDECCKTETKETKADSVEGNSFLTLIDWSSRWTSPLNTLELDDDSSADSAEIEPLF